MKLLWNGENIEPSINIKDIVMHDHAGGIADSIDIYIPDPEQAWAKWKPKKGDEIEVVKEGYSTGIMYFDGWKIEGQSFMAIAISTPRKSKSEAYREWNDVTFLEISREIAHECGLILETYDITNYTYRRVEQHGVGNFLFWKYLCEREGYSLKSTDCKAVIFNEKVFEKKIPVKTIHREQMVGKPFFQSIAIDLKSKGIIMYCDPQNSHLEYSYSVPGMYGGALQVNEYASSIGEAERFVKSALRQTNKQENQGFFSISLDTTLASAANIDVAGLGAANGKWYLTRVDHSLLNGYTFCWCRRAIEGDY